MSVVHSFPDHVPSGRAPARPRVIPASTDRAELVTPSRAAKNRPAPRVRRVGGSAPSAEAPRTVTANRLQDRGSSRVVSVDSVPAPKLDRAEAPAPGAGAANGSRLSAASRARGLQNAIAAEADELDLLGQVVPRLDRRALAANAEARAKASALLAARPGRVRRATRPRPIKPERRKLASVNESTPLTLEEAKAHRAQREAGHARAAAAAFEARRAAALEVAKQRSLARRDEANAHLATILAPKTIQAPQPAQETSQPAQETLAAPVPIRAPRAVVPGLAAPTARAASLAGSVCSEAPTDTTGAEDGMAKLLGELAGDDSLSGTDSASEVSDVSGGEFPEMSAGERRGTDSPSSASILDDWEVDSVHSAVTADSWADARSQFTDASFLSAK
jgi:hypothetical protein